MLRELRIQNYAIINEVSLAFSEGFNVITGETGAGKSILVDALSLILGGRSSPEMIRQGEEEAVLEARFDQADRLPLEDPISESSDDALIVKRVLSKSGKNRAYQNGSFANLSSLKRTGQHLAEIHGQHEHHNLIDLDWQLHLVDSFGRLADVRSQYEIKYREWQKLLKEQAELKRIESEGKREEAFLQYQLSELREAKLQPNEEELLEKEERLLKNWESVSSAVEKAYSLLVSEGSILSQLEDAGGAIQRLQSITGDASAEIQLWETSKIHLKELAALLRDKAQGLEFNPERLQEVGSRLYLIQTLKRKYGASLEEVLRYQQELEASLSRILSCEDRLQEIAEQIAAAEKDLNVSATALSLKRREVKLKLERKMKEELASLGMEKTRFEIAFREGPLSEKGADQIEFLIALPGEIPQSLSKIASGGELSRMMLALKVVLTEVDPVSTLVFDEVDAGIGGAVAEKVGRRLSKLAESHQVFCITHLPQIACFARHHYFVEKRVMGERIATTVQTLPREARIRELARMLGGASITPIALRHAEEMLDLNAPDRPFTPSQQIKTAKRERNK